MPFEFGFGVIRLAIDELEHEPGEPRAFMIDATAGEVAAQISTDVAGLSLILDRIAAEERAPGHRRGGAWEPSLPPTRDLSVHARVTLAALQVLGPRAGEHQTSEFWEFVIDHDDGSRVALRLSERSTRALIRRIYELIGGVIA